jgi:hypothetical protein
MEIDRVKIIINGTVINRRSSMELVITFMHEVNTQVTAAEPATLVRDYAVNFSQGAHRNPKAGVPWIVTQVTMHS